MALSCRSFTQGLMSFALMISCIAHAQRSKFSAIDDLVGQAIAQNQIPGAVVVIGHGGRIVFRKAYGERSLEPEREAMTMDTVFDMASLTKPLMTATFIKALCQYHTAQFNC